MPRYKETPILEFKLLLTEAGFEGEVRSINPEKIKKIYKEQGWHDPEFVEMYERAYESLYALYNSLKDNG
jgi:hypothetical protein